MKNTATIIELCKPRRGVKPKFTPYHVLQALILLTERPYGRIELSKKLGLGEASTRTLINRLKNKGLVYIDKVAGTVLTEDGKSLVRDIMKIIHLVGEIDVSRYCAECKGFGAIIRKGLSIVKSVGVLELRDMVVREGAYGALILTFKGNKLLLPLSRDFYEEFKDPKLIEGIRSAVELKEGDVIIIALCKGPLECSLPLLNAIVNLLSTHN
ncbi:MAG: hypothetical protein DRO18_07275 [Thermoprotei archaeon]|nr:MAG: hypothetical protein DRO18_07275 [Thermoprotei archaeon]